MQQHHCNIIATTYIQRGRVHDVRVHEALLADPVAKGRRVRLPWRALWVHAHEARLPFDVLGASHAEDLGTLAGMAASSGARRPVQPQVPFDHIGVRPPASR